ncbi:hypothetical protein PG993_002658 [Apiospora rasikravindrae]|uniref:Uncharacterized protein n=1 Tax=Apiospora rasikravindrae TaxID=990691 RepID=A0ABR1TZW6_9PEZI
MPKEHVQGSLFVPSVPLLASVPRSGEVRERKAPGPGTWTSAAGATSWGPLCTGQPARRLDFGLGAQVPGGGTEMGPGLVLFPTCRTGVPESHDECQLQHTGHNQVIQHVCQLGNPTERPPQLLGPAVKKSHLAS